MRKKELVITTMMVVSMMLVTACSKPVDTPTEPPVSVETMVEPETVTEVETIIEEAIEEVSTEEVAEEAVVEETTEEQVEIVVKYVNQDKVNVYAEASDAEDIQILKVVDTNYAFNVVGVNGDFTEVVFLEGTAFVKSEYLSDSKIQASWGTEETEVSAEQAQQDVAISEKTQKTEDGKTITEAAPQPAPESAPQSSTQQEALDKLKAMGITPGNFTSGDNGFAGSGHYDNDVPIVLH